MKKKLRGRGFKIKPRPPYKKRRNYETFKDGRFTGEESKLMEDFNSSLSFDKRLYKEDILGSKAHVKMLGKV